MKKSFAIIIFLVISAFFFSQISNACTSFGAITNSGTIIAKNRDYYYLPQKFGLVKPIQKFRRWYDNSYRHNNKFYALTSAESVSMGVNQNGLSAIEEDSLSPQRPKSAREYKSLQEKAGTPDGMVLYGILQNFDSVNEMIPYLSRIFSAAAPDFYQFSDSKKILTVEVARSKNKDNLKHKFTYQILSKRNDYFAHTNTYLSSKFSYLNKLISNNDSLRSAENRLRIITRLLSRSTIRNIQVVSRWFMDTRSSLSTQNNPYECLNTSLFRTDLQKFKTVNMNPGNNKIFGTVATMIVSNHGDFKKSSIYLMMLDSITTQKNKNQLIKYNVLHSTLDKLFNESKPGFRAKEFIRKTSANGICS